MNIASVGNYGLIRFKSKIVVLKKGNAPINDFWTYDNRLIPVVSQISYLGLKVTSNGKSAQSQITLAEQGNKAIFQLQKRLNRFPQIKISESLNLFDKLMSPIL